MLDSRIMNFIFLKSFIFLGHLLQGFWFLIWRVTFGSSFIVKEVIIFRVLYAQTQLIIRAFSNKELSSKHLGLFFPLVVLKQAIVPKITPTHFYSKI